MPKVDLRTYIALEKAFVRRLQRSWRIKSAPTYAAIAQACTEHNWDYARRLVTDLDMTEVGTENREWITYMLMSCAVFGANIVAKGKPSFVGAGPFDTFLKQTTNNMLQHLEHGATTRVQAEALQAIAEDEAKTKALKFDRNQPRDAKGRWSVTNTPEFKAWFGDWEDPTAHSTLFDKSKTPVSYGVEPHGAPVKSVEHPNRPPTQPIRPKVYYHGTLENVEAFEVGRPGMNSNVFGSYETTRHALFFAESPEHAQAFTSQGGRTAGANVLPVYLKMQAPLDFTEGVSDDTLDELAATGEISRGWLSQNAGKWESFDDEAGAMFVRALVKAGYDSVIFWDQNPVNREDVKTVAIFTPEQVKSALGNRRFDPNDPRITKFDLNQPRDAKGRWSVTGTPEFKAWFGDSKIVDDHGQPLVLYHGTTKSFDEFQKPGSRTAWDTGFAGEGFYFGDSKTASGYAGEETGSTVLPVYLHMEKPLRVQEVDHRKGGDDAIIAVAKAVGITVPDGVDGLNHNRLMPGLSKAITAKLQETGHDGVIYTWAGLRYTEYMVIDQHQIKSAIANRQFDPKDPRITKFDEAKHPRDEEGQFAHSGITEVTGVDWEGLYWGNDFREPDDYYYHVTLAPHAKRIIENQELAPGRAQFMGRAEPEAHSKGNVFLTDRNGVYFWASRVQDHAVDQYDDPPKVAVIRIPKSRVPHVEPDPAGTRDAGAPAYVVKGPVSLKFDPTQLRDAKGRWSVTGTAEFKAWFGDSKVVDGHGRPLVVYHGTSAPEDFDAFEESPRKDGFFFADKWIAKEYTGGVGGDRPRMIPVYLKMVNPLIVDSEDLPKAWVRETIEPNLPPHVDTVRERSIAKAKRDGNDGVIFLNFSDEKYYSPFPPMGEIYVVFDRKQIKSAIGNQGTFDPNDPRITKFDEAKHPRTPGGDEHGGEFAVRDGMRLATAKDADRLKALKTPPAWTHVQVSLDPKAELQATGVDAKGRTQYWYSAEHSEKVAAEKFARVKEFAEALPTLREALRRDLHSDDPEVREAAAALYLIDKSGFRIGSDSETKGDVKAYGTTTLLGKHVRVLAGDRVSFRFIGKKGVAISKIIHDPTLAKMMEKRKQGSYEKLFDTMDEALREYMEKVIPGFHPKDFRTHQGTALALLEVKKMKVAKTEKEFKKAQRKVATVVAAHLGNTPAVSLKSYIDPSVWGRLRVAA